LAVTGNATFDTNVLVVDAAANRVGVGLTAPKNPLHVNTSLQVGFVDASNDAMVFSWGGASTNGTIQTFSSSVLALNPAGNNVGIGTTSPAVKLQIVNDSATTNEGVRVLTLSQSTSGTPAVGLGAGISFQSERPLDSGLLERAAIYGIASTDADTAGELAFYTRTDTSGVGVNEKMRLTSGGYMRMASGTFGIQFNGDTAAANALDDYEEGTWTPSLGGNTTYDLFSGTYTKIGRVVTVNFLIGVNTLGTGSASNISGLPFTVFATNRGAGGVAYVEAPSTGYASINPAVLSSTNTLVFNTSTILGVWADQSNVFANGTVISGTVTYFA
jgi:hypothetical protein